MEVLKFSPEELKLKLENCDFKDVKPIVNPTSIAP